MATPMKDYELMMIFTPVLAEDEFKNAQKKFADLIKENGGELVHENAWGLRTLAYPIQKKTTGLYHVVEFKAPGESIEKLELQLNRDESVMRHMVTVLDKFAVAYNESRRSNKAQKPAAKEEDATQS